MGWQRNHRKHPYTGHSKDYIQYIPPGEQQVIVYVQGVVVQDTAYFGKAEVEVPLQCAPLSGDDLVQDRGQQKC